MDQHGSIDSLVRRLIIRAAKSAAGRGSPVEDRRDHAWLVHSLAPHIEVSERLCADVVGAALKSIDDHNVVRGLLEAAETLAPDAPRLVPPMMRLCATAYVEGRHDTVAVGLNQFARWASADEARRVPEKWFASVSRAADKKLPYLVLLWFRRFGAEHPGFLRVIRDHEECLLARVMPPAVVRGIHAAQPTVTGWIVLARHAEPGDGALGLSFGGCEAEAVATLREARDGASDDAVRATLSRWFDEVSTS
ncbi:MAG: hypothetical protein HYZ29_08530 [Myxococcales bacterium]|nr:hypothetical protein [Myxococcales bacterium]